MCFRLIAMFLCFSLLAKDVSAGDIGGPGDTTSFLDNGVTAHRGSSGEFPENTIPAFQDALKAGADRIQLDLLRSKDGQLDVIHDTTTGRVGDRDLVFGYSTYQ